ncbi:thiamine ABC transporter substrate-binding protein [Halobacterium litoreum]|uniref:Thiamine ABC transporter substrate binding subunit n=1 Tax=Halobacterium litoreum TaxID=2039234 RepID=A0ABD5NDZ3_9EURY|nr:thiamine ABC transporter substrate-binding protein [Halobacterium litoreum]UHH13780.1 thiamine ABC transporter substrate-binding protein [Halobacterium litoreum]
MTSRRRFLAGVGSAAALGLAGCVETSSTEDSTTSTTESTTEGTTSGTTSSAASTQTLKVGTTQSYVDAVSTSAGDWVKREFEAEHDAKLEWVVRENEINDFIQRRQRGVDLGADMYVGVTPTDLVRADETLDASLFESFDTDRVPNAGDIEDAYRFDPEQRILPTGSSYVCIVYDEGEVEEPTTLDDLTKDAWSNGLLLPNPQNTVTGLSFLLWTVEAFGEDGYLDYWDRLVDNGLRTTGSWNAAYSAYSSQEAPMVMSYSTDQVYAAQSDADMSRHQIAFPNDQGYAYVSGVARFAGSDNPDLAHTFADFLLDAETQQTTAVKNVGIPVVSDASLPEDMQQYAHVPEEKLQFGYETLKNNAGDWRETVARKIASQ